MKWRVPGQEVDQRKLGTEIVEKDCQARKLNSEDDMDCNRWRKQITVVCVSLQPLKATAITKHV